MIIESDNIRLWYDITGQGPAVVVQSHPVHGSQLYRETFKPLEQFAEVVYFDSRNTGRSTSTGNEISWEDFTEDLEILREYLKLPKFTLVGHSENS